MVKSVDEEGSCPFMLSSVPLTSSPISRAEEKLWADDFRHWNVTLLFSAVEGCTHRTHPVNIRTCTLMDCSQLVCARHSVHGLRGIEGDGVRSCLVWSGPGHSCSAWALGNVWREISLCLKKSSRCSYITGCLVMPQIKPQRSSCRRAAPHTHRHTLTGKINVYRRNSPFDSAVPWTAVLSELYLF